MYTINFKKYQKKRIECKKKNSIKELNVHYITECTDSNKLCKPNKIKLTSNSLIAFN